ncbi:3-oxoadipyl-CoA thiolase [Rosenbergiella australiborealis]|uniref:3-oxoadipyl-CoA thiolase n=1 Tax=Rosenbergiella australiborealis TaxID=1544696 RepID=A0ABS5T4M7_9GAMM|nr:3-oxoadipyl-CoA thiolase [Rosenbergiella australiborealis]MBT0726435.1 3-oxoadipyl-CoA thiolase [Rosenbergiella australiborealis]
MSNQAYLCHGLRTPFGRLNGGLAAIRADELAALPLIALRDRYPTLDLSQIDDVILGCANQAGEDNRNVARMATLLAGYPETIPGVTLNRLCGSSLDAVAMGARAIKAGEADLLIAGGVESMSRAPFVMGKADHAYSRAMQLEDTTMGWRFVNPRLTALYGTETMPQTAENLAQRDGITRADQDAYALRSQQRTAKAIEQGFYASHTISVHQPATRTQREVNLSIDEHPRLTTLEALQRLSPVVHTTGTITAGNASGLNDGACALLMASERAIQHHHLQPRARIVASACCGIAPTVMGFGPVDAVHKVLKLAGLALSQMDVIELNEAFAAQVISCARALGIPEDAAWLNPNGGAIALGHPLGASGGRLVLNALHQLELQQGRYALCTMCIGVGQGIAMIIERVSGGQYGS